MEAYFPSKWYLERKHRQIVETGLTHLSYASIPLSYWDHSFTHTYFIINRLPTVSLSSSISPFYALYNTHLDYLSCRRFGCVCFPHLRPFNKHKCEFCNVKCVYQDISPKHKDHKCLSSNRKIYISKDVIFHETMFPYAKLFCLRNLHALLPTPSIPTIIPGFKPAFPILYPRVPQFPPHPQ